MSADVVKEKRVLLCARAERIQTKGPCKKHESERVLSDGEPHRTFKYTNFALGTRTADHPLLRVS